MRLSVDSNDSGYPAWLAMYRRNIALVVTVDGAKVQYCFTADTERGIVIAAELDAKGRMQLDSKREAVKRRTLTGRVAIECERA